jgi:uncharacterized protein (DUF1697 family)
MDKNELDRYITASQPHYFDDWCIDVWEDIPYEVCVKNYPFFEEPEGTYNQWLNRLYAKGIASDKAADIICRAFKMFIGK